MSFRPGSPARSARVAQLDNLAVTTIEGGASTTELTAVAPPLAPPTRDSDSVSDSPLCRAQLAFADQLLSDLCAQPVESRLEFVAREISRVQALSSALVEEAQRLQVARHAELTTLMGGASTVASAAATSACRSSYSIQLAPLSLPRTLPLWDTVCRRVFGPKIALRMHLSVGGLGSWMNAQDTVFVLCAITLALLVLFDVLPRSLSWLSFACFLASFLTAPLHCNWPIVVSVLRTFDFWFLLLTSFSHSSSSCRTCVPGTNAR